MGTNDIFVLEQVLFAGLLINTLLAHDFSKQDMSASSMARLLNKGSSPCWLLSQGMKWVWIWMTSTEIGKS